MSTDVKLAKQAIHDKLESQINTAEAKLKTMKARAQTAKANVELKAITKLLTRKQTIAKKLKGLKKSGGDRFDAGESRYRGTNHRSREVSEGDQIQGECELRSKGAREVNRRVEESALFASYTERSQEGCRES